MEFHSVAQAGVQWHDLSSDRKSTRLNSSHLVISYAVFRLKKKRRRHVDHRHVRAGLLLCFLYRGEDRNAFVGFARFSRVDSRDVAVPAVRVLLAHLGVELARLAGDSLRHHPGVLVDEDRHQRFPLDAATTFWPASARSEEHTSELQSPCNLVCRLLLEKKKKSNVSLLFVVDYYRIS